MDGKIYTINRAGIKKEVTLDEARTWLKHHYDNPVEVPRETSFLWPHEFRLQRLNRKLRGITAEELWDALADDTQAALLDEAERWRQEFKDAHRPPEMESIIIKHKGQKAEIPMEAFAEAMDRIMVLAWKASLYKEESGFDWCNDWYVPIPPTDMVRLPVAQTAPEIFRHLQTFGILKDFEDVYGPAPQKCETIDLKPEELDWNRKCAQAEHIPLFRWLWKTTGKGRGGRRANSGRKKTSTYLSTRIPIPVFEKLKAQADAEGVSLSLKASEILERWAKGQPEPEE